VRHAYLRGSRVLRPDWAVPPLSGPAGAILAPEDPLREVVGAAPAPIERAPEAPIKNTALLDLAPVSFQGEPGAYSQEAIFALLGHHVATTPCLGFRGAFDAVHQGRAKAALLPVENSTTGSIHEVWDLMLTHDLLVVGELILPVHHALLAIPGTAIADITSVMSHPQALYQCEAWIGSHGWRAEPGTDTAGSARRVAELGDRTRAAIASPLAAAHYGLEVLAKNVQDVPENYTRFLLLVPRAAFVTGGVAPGYDASAKIKTSLVFAARHVAGSLYGCLAEFAVREVSLTKIESRPDRRTPWSYIFYVDIEGDPSEPRVAQALASLARHASFVRVLGTYPTKSI